MPYQFSSQQYPISEPFHSFNCVALWALAISSFAVLRLSRALAILGWISLLLGGIAAVYWPPVD